MDKRGLAVSVIIIIWVFLPSTHQYKKGHGSGFMFKYEPNYRERREAEGTLVDHIKSVINHYKREEAAGLPFIKDPLPINSFHQKFSGMTMKFQDSQVYGFSRFKVEKLNADLAELKVNMKLTIDELVVRGRYLLSAWISKTQGDYNMTVFNAQLDVDAELMVDELGYLQVSKMETDIVFGDLKIYFENLGFLGKMFQGIVNKVGVFIFETMKPTIWNEVEAKLTEVMNSESRDIPHQFPTSINPVDQILAHVRKLIKERNLDPVPLADYSTQSSKWSNFELYNGYLYGLSSIRRTGPMLLGFESNTIHMTVHLGVNNLRGSKKTNKMFYCKYFRDDIIVIKAKKCNHNFLVGTYEWGWTAMRGVLGRRGQLTFNLDFVNVEIRLQQSANLDKKPIVDSVNVTLGPTQLTSDGIGAVDYVLEMIFNVVPNMFRQRIADAAEYPLSQALEDELQKINIESFIDENM
ncbi:hypothetical protein Fcan01_12409 [Folsomia candida]|uniref:Circadian clock-controlled protein n=1 Tax=Folsomia candida TaxID=158441 RepID=A0A226E643_FOLCA|nr:hypothetical protein Fcan01_12409 [Folsomia candida]